MNPILILTLLSLGVARATRLVVADTFPPIMAVRTWLYGLGHRVEWVEDLGGTSSVSLGLKEAVTKIMGTPPTTRTVVNTRWAWLGELVTCAWCASGWLSLGAVAWAARVTSLPLPVAWWGATWLLGAVIVIAIESATAATFDPDES